MVIISDELTHDTDSAGYNFENKYTIVSAIFKLTK